MRFKRNEGESLKDFVMSFIKFGIVGVINTFISYAIVNTSYYVFNIPLQISNILAFVLSVLCSFLLNGLFVFKKKYESIKDVLHTLFKTYLTYSFTGLILTVILTEIECNRLGIPLYIASLANLVVTVPINFLLNKFWAFRKEKVLSDEEIEEMAKIHTFAICAYKESEYLEECVKSVINQEVPTNYLIATSTPNDKIKSIAEKYNIPYFVRDGASDIQDDWNFAYSNAKTELVTIAHQDDIYEPNYSKEILKNYSADTLMYNTNYNPYHNGKVTPDKNSKIKEILKVFTKNKTLSKLKFFKVASLAFGNTINCPSVAYNKKLLGDKIFTSDLKFALDWDTFLKIAKMKGRSLYIPKKLINYRIHDGATTKQFIVDNKRKSEDIIMFNKFWPKWITNIIMKFYVKSYDVY